MAYTIQVAAISGSRNSPSARFRMGQMVRPLSQHGVAVTYYPAPVSSYPPQQHWLRPFWGGLALLGRVPAVCGSWKADVTWMSREMISTLVTLEPLTKNPRVLDVDDAIWLHRGGRAARVLAEHSEMIIAGNEFLAEWFSHYNKRVVVIPTAVDTERFQPRFSLNVTEPVVIGWSGSSSNLKYLYAIEPALAQVLKENPTVRLRVVADCRPKFKQIPLQQVEFVPWNPQNEVQTIQEMSIGIMPLEDSDWTRGKCSYKMLLYMACGIPVVVSPVGMNNKLLQEGSIGLAARTLSDWQEALTYLLGAPDIRYHWGMRGCQLCRTHYSLHTLAPRLAAHLKEVA